MGVKLHTCKIRRLIFPSHTRSAKSGKVFTQAKAGPFLTGTKQNNFNKQKRFRTLMVPLLFSMSNVNPLPYMTLAVVGANSDSCLIEA